MGSGNYESQILEAIQILVDNAVSKANYDKTIQGTVSRCVDATIGKYIVKYQDSSFYAYSHNTETTYPAGTSVYVLVPGNDMSKDKSIIGTVDHLGPDYVSIIEGENGYEVTGVNTINADGTFGLCSYKKEDIKILYDRDNNVDLVGLDVFGFENYIKKSNSIICGATFKTALDSAQKYRGDYGIVFHLDFTDKSTGETVTKSYIVNVDQMTGNPYNYTVASRQYGIFDVDGANFISVKQIYLFAYDFPNIAEDKENDIFVSKVELSAANALDKEAAATCALTFVTPQGTYFDETDLETDIRTLQAQIRIKGNAIDNDSQNVDYYWFRENNNITAKSEKYNQYGGAGWECLNNYSVVQSETEENEAVVQWTRSGYQYTTKKADNVARETTYKCVAVYFDGTILSKTIVIYNYSSNYEISIKSDSGVAFNYDLGKPTLTCYVNGQEETSDIYNYVWSVINSSNQFSVLEQTTTENEKYLDAVTKRDAILAKISAEQLLTAADSENLLLYNQIIDQYEYVMRVEDNKIHNLKISSITNFSTYKCSVYKSGVFIGTASIIITNTEEANPNYTLIIDNGNQIFKYNEKGISPANGSNQTPQVIEPISFTLYDEKGQKINHSVIKNIEWKVPSSDTLLNVSLTHGNGTKNEDGTKSYFNDPELNISIAPNYNAHYDKNEIQLILTYNDKVISAKTNFTFVKEGESGTNGTDFVCKIVPNNIQGTVAPKYPTVIYNEYTQQYVLNYTPEDANIWFKAQLWHDGELIYTGTESGNTLENKQAKVQWSMLQNTYGKDKQTDELIQDASNFVINKDTAEITFNTTELENPANIVRCVVNYDNVDYYATLPITIIRTKNNLYEVQLVENSGFRNVMYTPDGQSPAFDNQPFELTVSQIVEGVKNDISQFSDSEFAVDYSWEVKGNVYYLDWQPEINLTTNSLYKSREKRNQKYFKPVDTYNGLCVTNALVCHITRRDEELASIHIPIHFYINRYGNAAMNGWDGNSISLDEEGGIILAPQIGAGSKNEDNTFTGVFMGSVKEPGAEKEEHGLFGYHNGQRTITLNSEDGSARFGKAGLGQIVIDPTTEEAVIRSGVYDEENGIGMEINLTEPSIKFASGKFEVDKNGNVTADSFATREEVSELEESIQIFNVQVDRDSILIPSTAEQYPIDSQQYAINFTGLYKGKETPYFTAEFISGFDTGITTSIQDNQILFNVDKTKKIQNNVNTYTIQFKFSDVVTVKTYIVNKTITVGLAVQGKDGYQGSDGKSAYQIWLEAGNIGTEAQYLASLKGADGEPGKDGEKGADGETGKSAYQIWLDAGNTGTEAQYLASLKGEDGADGAPGKDGQDGAPGKDGEKGDTGIGVSKIVEQYYLSTSNTTQSGGSWKTTQDAWTSGKYIWTRSEITWTDGTITHTNPVLAEAINKANTTANAANTNASNAVNTANTASSTANTAKETANQASQTAQNASANANEAKQEAAAATQTANSATSTANNALAQANTANQGLSSLTTIVENNYKDLQGQIDGAIATWFYSYDPNTANTLPTKDWTTDEIKDQHLGDLFYIVDNDEKAGQCFRYAKIDGVYKWVIVEDVEVAKAIADAANAQATADGKATIYTGTKTPTNPQSGDLWMKSENDGILTYIKQSNGTFAWVEYNKYTDDALATEAKNTADTAKNTADNAKQTADNASQTATNAHNEVQNTVKQVDVEYYVASSESEIPTDSSNWDTNAPQWSAGKFIWSRQKMTFVDASKPAQYSEPARVTGATGKAGQDGLSAYQIAVAGGFKGTEAEWLASLVGKDGEDGKDGAQGIQGPTGADGKTSYLHIAYANSSDGTKDFSTTVSANKLYIGQYTDFTEADSTTPSKYNWTLIKGETGKSAYQLWLDAGNTGTEEEYLESLKAEKPEVFKTIEGTILNIPDGKEINKFKIFGKSEQATRSGKNIIIDLRSSSNTYVNYNINTAKLTNQMTYSFISPFDSDNVVVYIRTVSTASIYSKGTINIVSNQKTSFTFDLTNEEIQALQNENSFIQLYKAGAEWGTPTLEEPQLESGNQATEYELYGAMPSPDYPSEINSIEGVNSRNLYDVNDRFDFEDIVKVDQDDWITVAYDNTNGTATKYYDFKTKLSNNIKPNTQYDLIIEIKNVSGTGSINFVSAQDICQFSTSSSKSFSELTPGIIKSTITSKSDFTECTNFLNSYGTFTVGKSGSITFRMSLVEKNTYITTSRFKYRPFSANPCNIVRYRLSNKNLFNLDRVTNRTYYEVTSTGINIKAVWAGSVFNISDSPKLFKPNTTYTMKAKAKVVSRPSTHTSTNDTIFMLYRAATDELPRVWTAVLNMPDKRTISLNTEKTYITTFKTPSDLTGVRVAGYAFHGNDDGTTTGTGIGEVDVSEIMLVEGEYTEETFPEFILHDEKYIDIDLKGRKICSLPNGVKDEVIIQNGEVKFVRNIRHVSLKISDMNNTDSYPGWTNQTQLVKDYPSYNAHLFDKTDFICNITNHKSAVKINTKGTGTLFLSATDLGLTQTQWKEQYPDLVFNLQYGIPEPEIEDLGLTEVPSLYDYTIIDCDNSSLIPDTSCEYYTLYAGVDGEKIDSIIEEYYLSESKETLTGSGWTTTPPTWSPGKYIWTRSKISYSNPTRIEYTTPLCDSAWEAVNELEIGARNLVLDSEKTVTSQNAITLFDLSQYGIDNIVGKTVTASFDVKADKEDTIDCYIRSAGSQMMSPSGYSFKVGTEWVRHTEIIDVISRTDPPKWFTIRTTNVSGGSGTATVNIKNVKLEIGNKATDWSPAPEDFIADIADLQTQVDGKIQTYNQTSDPSLDWTSADLKTKHTGDLWYNDSTKKTQLWNGTEWTNLENAEAQAANTLASKKAQVFTAQPTVPYYKGDLWVTALNKTGVVKTCQTTRTSGSYTASDWVEGLKYTDDTAVNNLEIGGKNLLLNTSFSKNFDKWAYYKDGTTSITEKYGYKCGCITHDAFGKTRTVAQSLLGILEPNTTYTVSVWALAENIVRGTTNPACMLYLDGTYPKDGTSTWFGLGSKAFQTNTGEGAWTRVTHTFTTDDVKLPAATRCEISIFTRDITGQVYFRDLKLEKGNKATDWSPATEDVINDAFNSVEIGGRNLILNSVFEKGLNYPVPNRANRSSGWENNTSNTTLDETVTLNGHKSIHRYRTGTTATVWTENRYYHFGNDEERNKDTTYKLSFYIYTPSMDWINDTNSLQLNVRFRDADGNALTGKTITLSGFKPTAANIWQKREFAFTTKASDNWDSFMIFDSGSRDFDYYLTEYKLEIGNKATAWTPAPEDVEAEMEDLVILTETQYCLGSSIETPPAESDAGWSAKSKVGNAITEEYLWVRTKNTTKSNVVSYSNYYCLVQAQKVLKSQTTEYLLSASSNSLTAAEKAEGITGSDNPWSTNKPTEPITGKDYLWTRIHAVYNYAGAGIDDQIINEYYDYTLDTSWHVLFDLTDALEKQIANILTDLTGGYVHIENGVILVGNDKDNPSKLIVINHKGIAFFDNEEDGWPDSSIYDSQTSAWSIDGTLNMDQIDVNGLKASSIENENLILGKGDADTPAISGDLDIFDKYGNLMFETVVNETGSNADHYIHGFKVYKYKQNADNTLTPNGFIYLSREGFKEYDAEENMIFGNDGDIFKTQQQIIAKTEGSTTFGARIVPMRIVEYPGTTNEVVHSGIAFLRL